MTNIREGIINIISFKGVLDTPESLADKILTYLRSQGIRLPDGSSLIDKPK